MSYYSRSCRHRYECPPYFYFRFVWRTDLQSIPHASTPMYIILTKFEVDMTILCRDFLTLTFDLLILNSWSMWRVTWPTLPPGLKTLRLSVHELGVTTLPTGYHWKCVRGHCTCAESRDPQVGDQKQLQFWNPRFRFAYSLCNFGGSMMKII